MRSRRRGKLGRLRSPIPVPAKANERWPADFVSDQPPTGHRFSVRNIVDDFSRECVLQVVHLSISGQRPARKLG